MNAIDYPTISVGAHENLVVRMSLASQVLMQRRGLDPVNLAGAMISTAEKPNPQAVPNVITVFSCMVAENFIAADPNRVDLNAAPTADYWATQIEDFGEVERVVWSALGKAAEARRAKLAAVPPREQAS